MIKKLKILFHGYIYNTIYYLDGKETDGMFYAKELQKTNQPEFRIEK